MTSCSLCVGTVGTDDNEAKLLMGRLQRNDELVLVKLLCRTLMNDVVQVENGQIHIEALWKLTSKPCRSQPGIKPACVSLKNLSSVRRYSLCVQFTCPLNPFYNV